MEILRKSGDYNIILNQENDFQTNLGWEEGMDIFEDEVLSTIINPIDNYDQSLYYMYYPSALKLYEFYKEKGLFLQQQEMKKFIQLIAEKSGKDFIKNSYIFAQEITIKNKNYENIKRQRIGIFIMGSFFSWSININKFIRCRIY